MVRRMLNRFIPGWFWGWLKNWLIGLTVIGVFVTVIGIPHCLTSYEFVPTTKGAKLMQDCHYIGPFGGYDPVPGVDVREDCPFISFFPYDAVKPPKGLTGHQSK